MNTVTPIKKKQEAYNMTPQFEAALVTLCCTREKFYARIGPALEPTCFARGPAVLAMRAAAQLFAELARGPGSGLVVLQRLRRWQGEGKTTQEELRAVSDMFDEAEDAGLPDEEQVLGEVVPLLQRRIQHDALTEGMAEFARRGDPEKVLRKLEAAKKLGQPDALISAGIDFGERSFSEMQRLRNVQRLKTGLLELDDALGGGAYRGTASAFMGGAKSGKSQGLVQVAVAGIYQGANTVYETLELPKPIVEARLAANMTGIATNEVLADPFGCGALEVLDAIREKAAGRLGRLRVQQFTPTITTVADLKAHVRAVEDEWGEPVHNVVIDYADKLGVPVKGRNEDTSYIHGRKVYEDFRIWVEGEKRWGWTASQGKRVTDKKGKKLDIDDVADSLEKARILDLLISLNPSLDGDQMTFFIAAYRLGKGRQTIGPLPTDFDCARIAPCVYDF